MKRIEAVTHRGAGTWAGPRQIVLRTVETIWRERFGNCRHSAFSYEVDALSRTVGIPSQRRTFPTEPKRADFLRASFGDLRIEPVAEGSVEICDGTADKLVGYELAAVNFIRNYVELQFDGPVLQFIALPQIRRARYVLRPDTAGFRDALCELIGETVSAFDVWLDVGVAVEFGDRMVELPPAAVPYESGEVAILRHGAPVLHVWSVGKNPYV